MTKMKFKDKIIPWYFVAFFLVLFIVDGYLVYLATSSYTGVVTENAYEKGLRYNDVIKRAKAAQE